MADKKISELNLHASPALSDSFATVNGGETKKVLLGALNETIRNSNTPLTASGITVGDGSIVPTTPQGATLGTLEKPFREIYLQSGSISIESDTPGDPAALISNNDGNLDISVGGMRLVEPGNSFIAETGSFSFISGSMTQVGDYIQYGFKIIEGELIVTGSVDITGSFEADLQENYVWLGDSNNRSIATPLSNLPFAPATSGSNDDELGGVTVRTLYTRNNVIIHNDTVATDLLSGSSEAFGSRNIPSSFLSNTNFKSKALHFRVFGVFTSGNTDCDIYLQIGNDILTHSNIGATLSQPNGHPFEILGEVFFTNGNARVCYSIGHCANNGDLKRYPLSDATQLQDVTSFAGGDFKIIIPTTGNIQLTSYGGYLQIFN